MTQSFNRWLPEIGQVPTFEVFLRLSSGTSASALFFGLWNITPHPPTTSMYLILHQVCSYNWPIVNFSMYTYSLPNIIYINGKNQSCQAICANFELVRKLNYGHWTISSDYHDPKIHRHTNLDGKRGYVDNGIQGAFLIEFCPWKPSGLDFIIALLYQESARPSDAGPLVGGPPGTQIVRNFFALRERVCKSWADA